MGKYVQPTARDVALFRHIGQRGLSNTQAIHQQFWAGRKVQTCQDRLTQLVKGGYLHTAMTDARGKAEQIYWLGRKAERLFSAMERAGFVKGRPAQAEIGHVLTTGEVLEKLKQRYRVTDVTTERALKGEHKRGLSIALADGRMRLDGVEYLLEIDSPHYTGQRLRKKVAGFGKAGKPTLWVVASQARLRTVSRAAAGQANIQVVQVNKL
jgi:hypothetical protein